MATGGFSAKPGEAGWKSLIPIYNRYVLCNVARRAEVFWKLIACGIAAFVGAVLAISGMASNAGVTAGIGYLLAIAGFIGSCVFQWQVCKGLAENFGLETAFAVGLFLLNGLFIVILGLGKYEYVTVSEPETVTVEATPIEDKPEDAAETTEEETQDE